MRAAPPGPAPQVAVVGYPYASNVDELHLLTHVAHVRIAQRPADLAGADMVILPGSKHVAADIAWLRHSGLDVAVRDHAAAGRRLLGVCGGAMLLGRRIDDPSGVEGAADGARVARLRHGHAPHQADPADHRPLPRPAGAVARPSTASPSPATRSATDVSPTRGAPAPRARSRSSPTAASSPPPSTVCSRTPPCSTPSSAPDRATSSTPRSTSSPPPWRPTSTAACSTGSSRRERRPCPEAHWASGGRAAAVDLRKTRGWLRRQKRSGPVAKIVSDRTSRHPPEPAPRCQAWSIWPCPTSCRLDSPRAGDRPPDAAREQAPADIATSSSAVLHATSGCEAQLGRGTVRHRPGVPLTCPCREVTR